MGKMGGLRRKIMMDLLLNDLASWTYIYNICVGVYGFFLFLYWAVKKGGASSWYIYVMALILGITIAQGFQLIARYFLLIHHDLYDDLLFSSWWAVKSWISGITMTCIATHATVRLIKDKLK